MSYHYDWVTRQIEAMAIMLNYILTGEKTHLLQTDVASVTISGGNELYLQLSALVRRGQICQAEDLLFQALEEPGRQVLEAAVRFYEELSRFSDETLRQANFSREEVLEGMQYVCRVFGIPITE